MHFKSLKSYLYLTIFTLTLLFFLALSDFYLNSKNHDLQNRQSLFIKNVNLFLENLSLEKDTGLESDTLDYVMARYTNLIKSSQHYSLGIDIELLQQRMDHIKTLFTLWEDQKKLHDSLNAILPSLSSSVEYIHSHHITYLKNILRKENDEENYASSINITRHDSMAISELDIISKAIDIQNSMVQLMEIFSRLQRGISPKIIQGDFTLAITEFYSATNTFEDYSLDAQDGLLIEELLLNGHTFEKSFSQFLLMEQAIQQRQISLDLNRREILNHIALLKKQNEIYYDKFLKTTETIKAISLTLHIILICILLFIARKIIMALTKTVGEAKKIQQDPHYRIPSEKSDYTEFSFIYTTLNNLSSDIDTKLSELSKVQELLESQVNSRTQELSLANQQLKGEIDERIKNDLHRQELEEKLTRAKKMEALGTLAGGVAHDLNNILSGILSYPELLLMDLPEKSHLRGPLQTIKSSGEKASVIVQDLLTMARRGVARHEPTDLNLIIDEFLKCPEYREILHHHPGVSLSTSLEAKVGIIHGSKVHLQKTLTNLISNAAESISGNGNIHITTRNMYIDTDLKNYDQVKEGEYIKIIISDTGIGISPENLERIFEPFFTTKTLGRSGSGLGMAVVWGTVKDHGGYIDVSSEKMKGTTFYLYFPLVRDQQTLVVHSDDIESLMARGEKVLIVDDVQEQREIASFMLKRLGYTVITVENGEQAIEHLKEKSVDILLLDMIMTPGIDGLETYRRILQHTPDQKAIIVSGYSESNKVKEAQSLGTGIYVKKPYTLHEIALALRSELEK